MSTSIAANPRVPAPVNEPARDFAPGSPESQSVTAKIAELRSRVTEIPHVIDGERRFGGTGTDVVEPHDHASVVGRLAEADADVTKAAIAASLEAQHEWSRTPWWERAAIFLRAGEPAAGKYRDELVAATMIGQSKTFHQAEIDATCEFADFMRFNTHLAQQIYADQPASLPGDLNIIDQRPLEGFALALTPFNFTAIGVNLPSTPALMGNTVVWKPSEKSALGNEVSMRVLEEAGLPPGVINVRRQTPCLVRPQKCQTRNIAALGRKRCTPPVLSSQVRRGVGGSPGWTRTNNPPIPLQAVQAVDSS
jgi:1-pyrroline-5-carboxylate dehydrogenase